MEVGEADIGLAVVAGDVSIWPPVVFIAKWAGSACVERNIIRVLDKERVLELWGCLGRRLGTEFWGRMAVVSWWGCGASQLVA